MATDRLSQVHQAELTESRLKLINRIAGTVLIAFGLILLLDGFVLR